jgi:hypothetical protein
MKTKGYKPNPKSNWKTKPYKGNNYKQRRIDDAVPTTLDKVMFVFKYIIYLTPICCCIMATWFDPALYDKWMMTAVHTLSLSILIQLTDN